MLFCICESDVLGCICRAVLCCAVLCCAVLCCAVLCCAVLCCAVLYCVVLCWAPVITVLKSRAKAELIVGKEKTLHFELLDGASVLMMQ